MIPEAPTDGRQVGHRDTPELDPHLRSARVLQLQRAVAKAGGRGSQQLDKRDRDGSFRHVVGSNLLPFPSSPTIGGHFAADHYIFTIDRYLLIAAPQVSRANRSLRLGRRPGCIQHSGASYLTGTDSSTSVPDM